jgi:DGC domain.
MPELKHKKVGIVSCSGEELPEGTVSRLAALKVLEELRPGETVTICLPLFLAGGEGDRAFAKFYPTIAIDGCEKRCAYRATEMYSNTPAVGIVITDLIKDGNLEKPAGCRQLNSVGRYLVEVAAVKAAEQVDQLLGKHWSRQQGRFDKSDPANAQEPALSAEPRTMDAPVQATCSCGSGIPIQKLSVGGRELTFVALPLIFQQFVENKKSPSPQTIDDLMATVRLYNSIGSDIEADVRAAIEAAYQSCWKDRK